jgi:hypothetical protein
VGWLRGQGQTPPGRLTSKGNVLAEMDALELLQKF